MSDLDTDEQVNHGAVADGDGSPAYHHHQTENFSSNNNDNNNGGDKSATNGDSRRKSSDKKGRHSSKDRKRKSRSVSSHSSSSSSRSSRRGSSSRHRRRSSGGGKKKHRRHSPKSSGSSRNRRKRHSASRSKSRTRSKSPSSSSRKRRYLSRTRSRSKSYDDYGWKASHFHGRGGGGGGYGRPFKKPISGFMVAMNDPPPPSRCLGVFGLSLYTDERTLEKVFGPYGRLENVQIVYDKLNDKSRGFGFIYYDNVDDAIEAKEKTTGIEIDGHRIRVDYSMTNRPHTPTPGMYMGKRDYPSYGYSSGGRRRRSRSGSYSPRR